MDKISVIVPVFRTQRYLANCIESIMRQDYKNLEIILVDDGSDDNSPEICDQYKEKDDRIVVIHQKNRGLSNARNTGLDIATGNYIGFVDSDDYIDPDMYSVLMDNMKRTGADVGICGFYQWDKAGDKKNTLKEELSVYGQQEIIERFFRINQQKDYFAVWCCLYSRCVLENVRFTEGIINEDVDFKYRIFLNSHLVCETTRELYAYNIGNISITRMALRPKDLDLFVAWKKVISYAKDKNPEYLKAAKFNYIRSNLTLLIKYTMFGISGFEDENIIIKKLSNNLRKNLGLILKSKGMNKSRKIAAVLCSISPMLVKVLFDLKIIERKL